MCFPKIQTVQMVEDANSPDHKAVQRKKAAGLHTLCKTFKSCSLLLHTACRRFRYSSYSRICREINEAHNNACNVVKCNLS